MGTHDGHRMRMRDRVRASGTESMQDHELLEYILFAFVPRRNTNEMAHALMERFGSFADVLNADAEELEKVPGMTGNAALFLSVLPEIFRRYAASVSAKRPRFSGKNAVKDHIAGKMFGVPVETVCAAALDAQDGLLRFERLAKGTGDGVNLTPRDVVQFALRSNAVSVVLAHNHPSGNARPSQSDFELTLRIADVLDGIGVKLADHIIFTDAGSYSFEANGLLGGAPKEEFR